MMSHNDVMDDAISMSSNPFIRFWQWLTKSRVTIIRPIAVDNRHIIQDSNGIPKEIKNFFETVLCHYPNPDAKHEKPLTPHQSGTSKVLTLPFKDDFQNASYDVYSGHLPAGRKAIIYLEAEVPQ
jgi:hypothetical protein